jgi:hypothetical protein
MYSITQRPIHTFIAYIVHIYDIFICEADAEDGTNVEISWALTS